jgi:hypothetical protein
MNGATINSRLLKSQMALKDVSQKDFAAAQKWSATTAYRKINGLVAFKVPEIRVCVELLALESETANQIFFAGKMF